MIGTKLYKNHQDDMEKYTEIAIWCNKNNATILDKGEYYEVVIISELTQEEKKQEQVNKAKSELRNLAIKAMMATLAGGDISAQQTEYQSNITALSDDVALLIPEVYPAWSANSVEYKVDDRVQYNGILYKVLTAHTSQETWKPDVSPSLFVKVISSISGEIPEWEQPSAGNAYMKGDKVRYNGKVYESLINNNVWKPDEYPAGWKEVTETITIL